MNAERTSDDGRVWYDNETRLFVIENLGFLPLCGDRAFYAVSMSGQSCW